MNAKNHYFLDAENPTEQARLINQANMLARTVDWLFPLGTNASTWKAVLDVACGPGTWVLDVAFEYPRLDVVGVDISEQMVSYARARAQSQGLVNAIFALGDATGTLYDDAASFDLVNARFLVGFMYPHQWPALLAECRRVLLPQGILCLTEGEWALTSSSAYQQYARFICQALKNAGRSFSIDGYNLAITPMLGPLIREAGFRLLGFQAHTLDISYGQEGYASYVENCQVLFELAKPFLRHYLPITQEELDRWSRQAIFEMRQESFCGIGSFLSIWGESPAEDEMK